MTGMFSRYLEEEEEEEERREGRHEKEKKSFVNGGELIR
jgi:hypothetical protein